MTEQMKKEIIRAFAYGKTPAEVADVTGMFLSEAEQFLTENESAIADKATDLKEAGYLV